MPRPTYVTAYDHSNCGSHIVALRRRVMEGHQLTVLDVDKFLVLTELYTYIYDYIYIYDYMRDTVEPDTGYMAS